MGSRPSRWMPVREAWDQALYGPAGFYRSELPTDHFRTSSHVGPVFAEMVLRLMRATGTSALVDHGAGAGELLTELHRLDPGVRLSGVDLRPRPAQLPAEVGWSDRLPDLAPDAAGGDTLLLANELLDNVPCDVVEVDTQGRPRVVEVDPTTGDERLGGEPPAEVAAWLERWWPIASPGERAEVGLARDEFWAATRARAGGARCLMVDYVHVRASRPAGGTMAAYRGGRRLPVGFAGDRDVTAHVAVDSLQARVGGTVATQAQWCARLRPDDVVRPAPSEATADPRGYLRRLARHGEYAELCGSPGLGDFVWLLSGPDPDTERMGA